MCSGPAIIALFLLTKLPVILANDEHSELSTMVVEYNHPKI